eukprot:352609-Chlamydomonas_euryale.AAC.2
MACMATALHGVHGNSAAWYTWQQRSWQASAAAQHESTAKQHSHGFTACMAYVPSAWPLKPIAKQPRKMWRMFERPWLAIACMVTCACDAACACACDATYLCAYAAACASACAVAHACACATACACAFAAAHACEHDAACAGACAGATACACHRSASSLGWAGPPGAARCCGGGAAGSCAAASCELHISVGCACRICRSGCDGNGGGGGKKRGGSGGEVVVARVDGRRRTAAIR